MMDLLRLWLFAVQNIFRPDDNFAGWNQSGN